MNTAQNFGYKNDPRQYYKHVILLKNCNWDWLAVTTKSKGRVS